ncbi:MAG: hypothetical protein EXR68_05455 [Dehalococcoidia bacterium]|nr:hypothetical protein [Dehalococcoidia bacterium]
MPGAAATTALVEVRTNTVAVAVCAFAATATTSNTSVLLFAPGAVNEAVAPFLTSVTAAPEV